MFLRTFIKKKWREKNDNFKFYYYIIEIFQFFITLKKKNGLHDSRIWTLDLSRFLSIKVNKISKLKLFSRIIVVLWYCVGWDLVSTGFQYRRIFGFSFLIYIYIYIWYRLYIHVSIRVSKLTSVAYLIPLAV